MSGSFFVPNNSKKLLNFLCELDRTRLVRDIKSMLNARRGKVTNFHHNLYGQVQLRLRVNHFTIKHLIGVLLVNKHILKFTTIQPNLFGRHLLISKPMHARYPTNVGSLDIVAIESGSKTSGLEFHRNLRESRFCIMHYTSRGL